MSPALSLMAALLGSAEAARAGLDQALLADVDPLHWCALELGVSDAEIMRRSAAWAGLAFFDRVPQDSNLVLEPTRLEHLASVRIYRMSLLDREVAYAAPDFFGLLRLAAARQASPALRNALCLVPASALRASVIAASGEALVDGARHAIFRKWPYAAAHIELTTPVRRTAVLGLLLVLAIVLFAPWAGLVWLTPLWAMLVILPALLRLFAIMAPARQETSAPPMADEDLPHYSVLVPLRDEANMVDQLCDHLGRLDYPPEKLEILFLVESRSPETIAAVRERLGDPRFHLVEVPDAAPRTKPKALDFGLPLCRGEFVVVYDAEDRPQPDQLRRVVTQFSQEPQLECIQACLVIANGHAGFLPASFAGEYAGLFGVMLPALARWGLVMPLGGTSNHFRLETLRGIGGWDAYNVTEDADLAVRLARRRLRTGTSTSYTLEDAPLTFRPWLGQRTRWMKGWMQTFVVHSRRLPTLVRDMGWYGAAMFQVIILGMLVAPLLHVGVLIAVPLGFLSGVLHYDPLDAMPWIYLTILVFGHAVAILTNIVGLRRSGQDDLIGRQLLLPIYWVLIALATLRALHEFAEKPFHWFKTPHEVIVPSRERFRFGGVMRRAFGRVLRL